VLGAQSARTFRHPGPVTLRLALSLALLAVVGAGCATRADLMQQDRHVRSMLNEQRKAIDQLRREVERLRADVDEGGGGRARAGDERVAELERRLALVEHGTPPPPPEPLTGETPVPLEGEVPPDAAEPPPEVARTPPTTIPPAPPPVDDSWRRDVAQEQAAVGTMNVPEKTEYLAALDGVSRKDCASSVPQLNGIASKSKGSALADNALYWAARCYAARGDQNQAISKFYDVVTRYPKSDKAPAALWQQGNLFLQIGDTPDARLALGKLIRDYPNSPEAAQARQKLSEIEQ
jgi:tol-pal system protein YbgF